MEITIKRIYFRDTYTIGALQVNGEYMMDTLEPHAIDWRKEKKRAGKTAIPEGRYLVKMRHSQKYRKRMPFFQDVPYFTGVMIHTGNTAKDTRGCILVGKNTLVGQVTESRVNFQKLYPLLLAASERGEDIWVTVRSPKDWKA